MKTTVEISERYRISYRDATIVVTTEVLEASVHSENLNNKQLIGGVTMVTPFHSQAERGHRGFQENTLQNDSGR